MIQSACVYSNPGLLPGVELASATSCSWTPSKCVDLRPAAGKKHVKTRSLVAILFLEGRDVCVDDYRRCRQYNNGIGRYPQLSCQGNTEDRMLSLSLLSLNMEGYPCLRILKMRLSPVNLLASKLDCYCLCSPLSLAPRAALHSYSHLCALGAGMHAACPLEEAAS